MIVVAMAMRARALKWWIWWSYHHPNWSWDTFTTMLLCRFKPEWREMLPLEEDDELVLESTKPIDKTYFMKILLCNQSTEIFVKWL